MAVTISALSTAGDCGAVKNTAEDDERQPCGEGVRRKGDVTGIDHGASSPSSSLPLPGWGQESRNGTR